MPMQPVFPLCRWEKAGVRGAYSALKTRQSLAEKGWACRSPVAAEAIKGLYANPYVDVKRKDRLDTTRCFLLQHLSRVCVSKPLTAVRSQG